jgi:hypothetical protein
MNQLRRQSRGGAGHISIALALVCVVGCSAGSDSKAEPRRVTRDESEAIASALYENYQGDTAAIKATIRTADGSQTMFNGVYDWKQHHGRGSLAPPYRSATTVVWTLDAVALSSDEAVFDPWQADPAVDPVARALALITALGTKQPDNPLLIAQRDDVTFLRTDTLDNISVNVFQIGATSRYWLTGDGELLRFEASAKDGSLVLIDLGERKVATPVLPVGLGD